MEALIEILTVYSTLGGLFSLVGVVLYVLQGLGLYTIAQRRGLRHAWLAWVPVGSLWILGSISDDFQYRTKGVVQNRRKLLLFLSAVMLVLAILVCGTLFDAIFELIDDAQRLERRSGSYTIREYDNAMEDMLEDFFVAVIPMALWSLVMSAVSVVTVVFQYICLYNLFDSCDPGNKVLYLVLSIFFSGLSGIFIFVCRNKDEGLRPAPQPGPYGYYMPPQEPWQNPDNREGM